MGPETICGTIGGAVVASRRIVDTHRHLKVGLKSTLKLRELSMPHVAYAVVARENDERLARRARL